MSDIVSRARNLIQANSPAILTSVAVTGVVATAYLTGRASFKAARIIDTEEAKSGTASTRKKRLKERIPLVWKCYIPPALTGAATIGCIVGASNANAKRTAAAATAYTLTERAFAEYRDKVAEQLGERKEEAIRADIAEDKILANPPSQDVLVVGDGKVLCCELYTGRYFHSTMETLRRVENDVNAKLNSEQYVQLSDFYYAISLPNTDVSGNVGWSSGKHLKLEFSTILTPEGVPCLAFGYNYCEPL